MNDQMELYTSDYYCHSHIHRHGRHMFTYSYTRSKDSLKPDYGEKLTKTSHSLNQTENHVIAGIWGKLGDLSQIVAGRSVNTTQMNPVVTKVWTYTAPNPTQHRTLQTAYHTVVIKDM